MGSLSPVHWLVVIVVVLLVFGPSRLADVGKGLGEGIRSFKKGLSDDDVKAKAKRLADSDRDEADKKAES
ncbi:MAG: twin-arginine translocase TatA/TatE family subunit [Polyangiaceae bacterium]|nr:twin-arginine translocase TatA/TatE family subunit [Polyangiaceae bacterium]